MSDDVLFAVRCNVVGKVLNIVTGKNAPCSDAQEPLVASLLLVASCYYR